MSGAVRRLLLVAAVAAGLAFPASGSAELAQHGDLFANFDGGISPRSLPRNSLAPVGVRIEGRIRVPPHREPPALRRITVAFDRGARLDPRGLPVCRPAQIRATATSEALRNCGPALVGTGGITARTSLPEQPTYPLRAEVLLFNARLHGRPAILAHVYQRQPFPLTRLLFFTIRRRPGTFGEVISARLSPDFDRTGYLQSIFLRLQRSFRFRGRARAYLSAACSAPPGIYVASFPFARASMSFADGRTLASAMLRTCSVTRSPRALASTAPFEPDDSILAASGPLSAGQSYAAAIESPGDRDYYFFYVTAGGPTPVSVVLGDHGGGSEASALNAAILDSTGAVVDPFAYSIGSGGQASTAPSLGPGKYFVEVDSVAGSAGGVVYSLATGGGEGAFGSYATIAARCEDAAAGYEKRLKGLRSARGKLQHATARMRGARLGTSAERRKARAGYRRAKARLRAAERALQVALEARSPWCSIPR